MLAQLVRERQERQRAAAAAAASANGDGAAAAGCSGGGAAVLRNTALARLRTDLDNLGGIRSAVARRGDNPYEVSVTVTPQEGMWSGGTFRFRFTFPEQYPYEGPKVRYTGPHRIYHPNIASEGATATWSVCLGLQLNWLPTYQLRDLVIGLEQMFVTPNFDDPLPGLPRKAAEMYGTNKSTFTQLVKSYMRGTYDKFTADDHVDVGDDKDAAQGEEDDDD